MRREVAQRASAFADHASRKETHTSRAPKNSEEEICHVYALMACSRGREGGGEGRKARTQFCEGICWRERDLRTRAFPARQMQRIMSREEKA
jgi:hypothetical protein